MKQKLEECERLGIIIPDEFFDFLDILIMGAKKYEPNNWLEPEGTNSSHKNMHASLFRHVAESSSGKIKDEESGLHPLLHATTRCLMHYTRQKRGIKSGQDK